AGEDLAQADRAALQACRTLSGDARDSRASGTGHHRAIHQRDGERGGKSAAERPAEDRRRAGDKKGAAVKVTVKNIFAQTAAAAAGEEFLTLVEKSGVRIERIVSHSHSSPK